MMMNPWLIVGLLLALAASATGGFASGDHYRGLGDAIAFQKERDGWAAQQQAIEDAHQKALAQTESDRDALQRYISNTLAPKYAQLAQANRKFQSDLANRSDEHARTLLPADDHACDLPAGLLDDWRAANAGTGDHQGAPSVPVGGVDASLWGSSATGGTGTGATLAKPPGGSSAVPRLRATP